MKYLTFMRREEIESHVVPKFAKYDPAVTKNVSAFSVEWMLGNVGISI